jgi:hypothetical protein
MFTHNQKESQIEIKNPNLNSYENLKQIESGVNHLVSCLEKTRSLRVQNEIEINNVILHLVYLFIQANKIFIFFILAQAQS